MWSLHNFQKIVSHRAETVTNIFNIITFLFPVIAFFFLMLNCSFKYGSSIEVDAYF